MSNLTEILNTNGTLVSITLTATELKEFALYCVNQAIIYNQPAVPDYVTSKEAAEILCCSSSKLWRLSKSGQLHKNSIGLYSREELKKVLKK
jgi:hypothetical protein